MNYAKSSEQGGYQGIHATREARWVPLDCNSVYAIPRCDNIGQQFFHNRATVALLSAAIYFWYFDCRTGQPVNSPQPLNDVPFQQVYAEMVYLFRLKYLRGEVNTQSNLE